MMQKNIRPLNVLVQTVVLFLLFAFHSTAHSQLSALGVSPNRVVIEANEKSGSIVLHNTSKADISYRMKMVEFVASKDGRLTIANKKDLPATHRSAAKIVRFSPRQVRLKPGEKQVIRVIAKRKRSLPPGEYRSHLIVQALPMVSDGALAGIANGDSEVALVSASSGANMGISMPIIVRQGDTQASVSLGNAQLVENEQGEVILARVTLERKGNRSVFGDISVSLNNSGKTAQIGALRGYGIYDGVDNVVINIPVRGLSAAGISKTSTVNVRFVDREIKTYQNGVWLDQTVPAYLADR